jgi:hypothetical protein
MEVRMARKTASKLCFAGVFVTLAGFALAGCGSGHTSKGGAGYATFDWYIHDIEDTAATPASALTCTEAGAGTVVVTLTDQATGTVYTQNPVACADGAMSTADVPAGSYTAGFDLYGDPAIYGNPPPLLDSFDATGTFHILGGANDFRSQYAPFIVQAFTVDWSVYVNSALSSCAAVGASYVDLDFAVAGSTAWVTRRFSCSAGGGVSYAIPFGPTSAQWKLYIVDTGGNDLQTIDGGAITLPTTTNVNLTPQYFSF